MLVISQKSGVPLKEVCINEISQINFMECKQSIRIALHMQHMELTVTIEKSER